MQQPSSILECVDCGRDVVGLPDFKRGSCQTNRPAYDRSAHSNTVARMTTVVAAGWNSLEGYQFGIYTVRHEYGRTPKQATESLFRATDLHLNERRVGLLDGFYLPALRAIGAPRNSA